jgi:hypothetical protein
MTADRQLGPEVVAGLEARGPEGVRILLGPAPPAAHTPLAGLYTSDSKSIIRSDAELWLKQKEAEGARRDTIRFLVVVVLSGISAVAAIVAAWEGWRG